MIPKSPAALGALLLALGSSARRPLVVAHRGASHAAPENSLAAFDLAWREGADAIECDFRLTSDREVVCTHDPSMLRTAGESLVVARTPLARLKQLDIGRWKDAQFEGERIATLAEVLTGVPLGKRILIELKTGPEIVEPLAAVLQSCRLPAEQITVMAFDRETVRAARSAIPSVNVNMLVRYRRDAASGGWLPGREEILAGLLATGASGLGTQANVTAVDPLLVSAVRDRGLGLHVWTINDAETARYFQSLDVDSMTTDHPAWLLGEIGREVSVA